MTRDGAEVLARALTEQSAVVFTHPGGHFLPLYRQLREVDSGHMVLARHEQGAVYMASGYALAARAPGFVLAGAPGPGATNLVTGVANALSDSIPLVVVTAEVDSRYRNMGPLQLCDTRAILRPVVKWQASVGSVGEIPRLLSRAAQIATSGRPGPVHISVAQEVQSQRNEEDILAAAYPTRLASPAVDGTALGRLAAAVEEADRPAIIAGHGLLRGPVSSSLASLAERMQAPVATSRSGIGAIPRTHPLSVGMLGFYGSDEAREAIGAAEVVLILGCALGEQTTLGWRRDLFAKDARIWQVDIDPEVIGRTYTATEGMVADANSAVESLTSLLSEKRPWFERSQDVGSSHQAKSQGTLSMPEVLGTLNSFLRDEEWFVSADIGNHRLWACDLLRIESPNQFLQSCEFDAMGFALPAGIGASLATGRAAVSISGDGGFVHTMGELAVAAERNLPVLAVVIVDGALGILRHQAESLWGKADCVMLQPIDFEMVGRGLGAHSITVHSGDEWVKVLAGWRGSRDRRTWLCQIPVDPNERHPALLRKIAQRRADFAAASEVS